MNLSDLFGIGGSWTNAFKSDASFDRRTRADAPLSTSAITVHDAKSDEAAVNTIREQLRAASGSLRDALGTFKKEKSDIYGAATAADAGSAALVGGTSGRVNPFNVDYAVLKSTVAVNTQTPETARRSSSAIGLDTVTAQSASTLTSTASTSLSLTGAASTKTSKAEISTANTGTYNSNTLHFSGSGAASTSVVTLSGTYVAQGKAYDATTLTVTVTQGGTIRSSLLGLGKDTIKFNVKDQTGETIFSYSGGIGTGDSVNLGSDIGLTATFGDGTLTANHTASVGVQTVETSIDPNARFNDTAANRPQFDSGMTVVAGTFQVNGVTIDVAADDTINAVLQKITDSAAGVTATLANDKVTLTTKANSDTDITVATGTSGFVKAVKLDGSTPKTTGALADDERILKDLGGYSNGTFVINGTTITVDKNADTLQTVMARINASGAGVTATLDRTSKKITLSTSSYSEDAITLGADSTNFFTKMNLSTATTVRGNVRDDLQVFSKTTQFASVVNGSFTVNGVSISVNKTTDTVQSIVSRINSSVSDVTASYDSAADTLVLTPTGGSLSVSGDTSGFLTAAKMAAGTTLTQDHANADASFNATGLGRAFLDPSKTVTAGSFKVNGVSIAVGAGDTINTVLARITNSAAGVTATYDGATELVTLMSRDGGTGPIALTADTSGFLAAVKLDGTAANSTNTVAYSAFTSSLGQMSEYSGVRAGTLTINGQDVAIDPSTTTMAELVTAIDGLAGVRATLDQNSGRVYVMSEAAGGELTFADTSGILDVLGIDEGTVDGVKGNSSTSQKIGTRTTSNADQVKAKVGDALTAINRAIAEAAKGHEDDAGFGTSLRRSLESAVQDLRDQGFRGFDVSSADGKIEITLSGDQLEHALDVLRDDLDLSRALSGVVDSIDHAVAVPSGWDRNTKVTNQQLHLEAIAGAQQLADLAAASLLSTRSSLTPVTDTTTALKAYSKESSA